MPSELELNLQKTETLENEVKDLKAQIDGLAAQGKTDDGLQAAIDAKKKQIAELNEEARKAREQDKGHFDSARADNINAAFRILFSKEAELANNPELQTKLRAEFAKFDEKHFNVDEILNDLRFAWVSLNRSKTFQALDEFEKIPEEVRRQQADQMAGGGAGGGAGGDAHYTREEIDTARLTDTTPEYVRKSAGSSQTSGGLIGKDTKAAR